MKPLAVIFDMDGTLIDARDWHFEALNEALGIFGFEISERDHEERFDGLSTRSKLEILSDERGLPRALFPVIASIKQDRTLRIVERSCFPRIEHLLLFQALKEAGLSLGVATNSIAQSASTMLTKAGLMGYLDVLVTNEDVSKPKPDPEIYLRATSKLGFSPDECIAVEDGEYGAQAALRAGLSVLRVTSVSEVRISLFEETLTALGIRI